jgi:glutaredoxin
MAKGACMASIPTCLPAGTWSVTAIGSGLEKIGVYRAGEPHIPVLSGSDWCPYCVKARQYFHRNGIRFHDLDIERDAGAARQHKTLGHTGVPVLVYEDRVWSGFEAATMDRRREWIGNGQ